MATSSTQLGIEITADNSKALRGLKGVEEGLEKVERKTKETTRTSSGLSDALKGVALGAGIKVAIGEYEEAEKVARRVEAAIKSTGGAAGVSADDIDKMSDRLSKLGAVDDEVVKSGAAMLLTFTNIRGEAFEPTLEAAANMSVALGTDIPAAAQMVGKALQDPTAGLTRLTRAGVVFTEQQKDQIRTLQASGDTLGAQKVILAELEKEFGGQLKAGATDSERMKVAMGNAAEAAGGVLAPALEMTAKGAEKAAAVFEAMPKPLQGVVVYGTAAALIGPRIVEGFSRIGESVATVKGWGQSLKGAGKAAEDMAEGAGAGASGASKLGAAIGAIGVGAAAAGMIAYANSIKEFTFNAEEAAKATDEQLLAATQTLVKIAGTDPLKDLDLATLLRLKDISEQAGQTIPGLGDAIAEVQAKEEQAAVTHDKYGKKVDGVKDAAIGAVPKITALSDAFAGVDDRVAGMVDHLGNVEAVIRTTGEATDSFRDIGDAASDLDDAEKALADAHRGVADAARGVSDAERSLGDARRGAAEAAQELEDAQRDAAGGSRELEQANRAVKDAEDALAQAQRDSRQAQLDLTQARADAVERLDDLGRSAEGAALSEEAARIGLQEAQQRLAQLGQNGEEVTATERARAQLAVRQAELAVRDAIDRREEAQSELNDAERRGVEGSDEVVAARDRIAQAHDREGEAQDRLSEAQRRVVETQEELAGRVEEAQKRVEDANRRVEDAIRGVNDAQRAVSEAQQAEVDAADGVVEAKAKVEEAARKAADKVEAMYEAQRRAKEETGFWTGLLPGLQGALDGVADSAENAALKLAELAVQRSAVDLGDAFNEAFSLRPGRASGGRVTGGVEYRVNETGQEFFRPDVDGTIYPSQSAYERAVAERGARSSGGAAAPSVTVNVTAQPGWDPYALGDQVGRTVAREVRLMAGAA